MNGLLDSRYTRIRKTGRHFGQLCVNFNCRNWHRALKSLPEFPVFGVNYSVFFFFSLCTFLFLSLFLSNSIYVPLFHSPFSVNETMCELEGYDMKMCVHVHTQNMWFYFLLYMIIFYALLKSKWNYSECIRQVIEDDFQEWNSEMLKNWKCDISSDYCRRSIHSRFWFNLFSSMTFYNWLLLFCFF